MIHNSWKTEIWFFFSIIEHSRDNLKPPFLIKSGYYIVPSPSTALHYYDEATACTYCGAIKVFSLKKYYYGLWKGQQYRQDICARTTDTQWRLKSKKPENLGLCGRQNMLRTYLKIWNWELIFGRAVKAISSPGVRSPCVRWFSRNFLTPQYF